MDNVRTAAAELLKTALDAAVDSDLIAGAVVPGVTAAQIASALRRALYALGFPIEDERGRLLSAEEFEREILSQASEVSLANVGCRFS